MDQSTKDNGSTTKFKELAHTSGQMGVCTLASGTKGKCRVLDFILGQIKRVTKENITRIRSKGTASIHGQTAKFTKDTGEKASNTG